MQKQSSSPTSAATARTYRQSPNAANEAAHDSELVRRFKEGEEPAFVEIMERYRSKIYSITLGFLHDRTDAEEITQDTFIRAYRGLVNFRGDSSLATWLYRIAVNLARNRYWYFHRRHRQDALSLDHQLTQESESTFADLIADSAQDPAQETAVSEFSGLVETCLAQLDSRHREILVLRNALNRSYEEIATALGINVGTVKSRIARARENLRAKLAETCAEFSPDAEPSEWFL
ncbi:MAG: sigma-70 family RNA polymerase sigma factor, partial [Verrucomicrobia bacterium]|nr:sigma-70 family RNA polymerase sigma factor [Verrucomicrobiota bacterium]